MGPSLSEIGIARLSGMMPNSMDAPMSLWSVIDTSASNPRSSICVRSQSNAARGFSGGVQ